ncbi:hypothetical protein ABZ412_18800 [Nocardia sp. NPDC005746]|uniref:hypothetical protein n=1 Tax=Nocardia sp. NPDC005746 TaxID=3157062 RepID=UPI0033F48911
MVSGRDESADRQASEGGAPESEFGPSLNDFGPSLNDFGPAPVADGPSWSPVPGPQSPDLAWRPAGAPPQYRAPDAWQPTTGQYPAVPGPSTGQYPAVNPVAQVPATPDIEETVKIPPGGPQSAAVDVERTTRIPEADSVAAERNSAPAEADGSADSWWRSAPSGFPPAPPAESAAGPEESLSWADDPIAKALAPKITAPQRKPEPEPRSWRKIGLIAGAAVTVLAVAGGVTFALTRGGADTAPTAGVTTGKPSPTVAALSCPAKRDGKLTIGNGAGGTGSGVDAILGFQHAFYTDRSGVKARTFVAPDSATVSPAEVIQQQGIDQVAAGTSYCLRIVEIGPETYDVDVTEHGVDGITQVYPQRVVTVVREGKHLIFFIDKRGG